MSVQTQVVWNLPMDQEVLAQILTEAQTLKTSGLEAADPEVLPGPGENQTTGNRFWVDLATAESWIAFVEQFSPVSAAIL